VDVVLLEGAVSMIARSVGWLQPRDYPAAARTLGVLTMVAAMVTVVFVAIDPRGAGPMEIGGTVFLGLLAAAAGWRVYHPHHIHPFFWAVGPLLAVALIVALDFVTQDGSTSAQVFFFFPVLYAASQLRRAGAVLITGVSIVGEGVVVFGLQPIREAVVSGGYVSAVMITTAGLLVLAGERQQLLVEKLRQAAAVDSLTGLVTRRVLDQAAQSAISGAAHHQGTALMLIDIDNFKQINDQFGHPGGDEVLVQLSQLITKASRPTDVISRLGGDEIALLLVGINADTTHERADALLHRVRAHTFRIDDAHSTHLTVSVGIAHAPSQADDYRGLYLAADQALYRAKRLGRNQAATATEIR
jgi:diguanylate cyclase (GGDEF)-like protein